MNKGLKGSQVAYLGLFLILLGTVLVLKSNGYLGVVSFLWPILPCLVGILVLLKRHYGKSKEFNIFLGGVLILGSIISFLLAGKLIPGGIRQNWPLYLTVCGLALIPYGISKKPKARIAILIPSGVMVLMSLLFLMFSHDILVADYADFVLRWWPLSIIAAGIIVLFSYFGKELVGRTFSLITDDSEEDFDDD